MIYLVSTKNYNSESANHVETRTIPWTARRGKFFIEGKGSWEGYRNEMSIGSSDSLKSVGFLFDRPHNLHWLSSEGTEEEDFLLSVWLCYCHRTTELLLTSWLYFNWGFCLLIFAPSFTHLHPQASQILKHKTQCYRISCFSRTLIPTIKI